MTGFAVRRLPCHDEKTSIFCQRNLRGEVRPLITEAVTTGARVVHVEPTHDGWQIRFRRASGTTSSRVSFSTGLGRRLHRLNRRCRDVDLLIDGAKVRLSMDEIPTHNGPSWIIRLHKVPRTCPTLDDQIVDHVTRNRLRDILRAESGIIVLTGTSLDSTAHLRSAIAYQCVAPDRRVLVMEEAPLCSLHGAVECTITDHLRNNINHVSTMDADVIVIGQVNADPQALSTLIRQTSRSSLVVVSCDARDLASTTEFLKELDREQAWLPARFNAIVRHDEAIALCLYCRSPTHAPTLSINESVSEWFRSMAEPAHEANGCDSCLNTGMASVHEFVDVLVSDPQTQLLLQSQKFHSLPSKLMEQRRVPDLAYRYLRDGLISEQEFLRLN